MTALTAHRPLDDRSIASQCLHCGTALTEAQSRFCCIGCSAAYALIQDLGLGQFYRRRVVDGQDGRPLRPEDQVDVDYSAYVGTDKASQSVLHLMVEGISCAACVWLIESVLAQEPALTEGRVNLTTRRLVLRWKGPATDAGRYVNHITSLGFRLVPFDPTRLSQITSQAETELLKALAVAGFAASNVMLLSVAVWTGLVEDMGPATRDLMHWVSALIALPAILYAGRPFFRSAIGALRAGRTNMDVPISIGVTLAALMSLWETTTSGPHAYFDSAVALLFFLLIGRYLDVRARGRARSAAEHLLSLGAGSVAIIARDGTVSRKPAQAVSIGDTVLIAAGERIAIDGTVIEGRSAIDASLVTGEAVPNDVGAGTSVFAGMVNLTGALRLKVTATGEKTLLAEIVRLMEAAEHGRGRFVALADRVARAYAPLVHSLALLTFLGWTVIGGAEWQDALLNAVAVLIITCPCALALAVPVVQVVASGRLLRSGILLKSPTALERLGSVDTVVFDKTGTLTKGRLVLVPDRARTEEDMKLAASLAQVSRHPLSRALCQAVPAVVPAIGVVEHPGQGLSLMTAAGEVRLGSHSFCNADNGAAPDTGPELWLSSPGREPVRFAFTDELRGDAGAVIQALKGRGFSTELLSGDRSHAVAAVADALHIETWQEECSPAAKVERLRTLAASGRHTLMVGDGLNDAPALGAAEASMSPSSAADVSQTAADVVFQGEKLSPVLEVIDVARSSARLIRQNLALAILYNLGAVPLAMAGHVTPLIAAIAMSSSSLLVIGNALRLSRSGRRS